MSSASEQPVQCSDRRALPLHHQPALRHLPAEVEVGEGGAIGAEAPYASLPQAEGGVAEEAKQPRRFRRSTSTLTTHRCKEECRQYSGGDMQPSPKRAETWQSETPWLQ